MSPNRMFLIMAAAAACTLSAVPVASASTDVQTASSGNWAGYVVGGSSSGAHYKNVSGSWVVPAAKCSSGQGYSSFWVGIGGSGSGQTEALEQTGTEADCNANGSPSYFAWYELVPSAPVKVNMAVHPGDHITGKVTVEGTNVTVSLSNATSGASFSKTLQMSNPDTSSAEWIAEAPSTCSGGLSNCTPLSLADFGTVQFTNSNATTTDGHTGTISDSAWSTAAVTLSPSASQSGFGDAQFASYSSAGGATPSSLSSDGSAFSVAWSADGGSGSSDVSGSAGSGDPPGGYGGYGDPTGGYGGYGDPTGGYGGYGDRSGGYGGYGDPTGGYGDPTGGYGDPAGGFGSYGDGGWSGYSFSY
ncbi:MAG: G1 family glutamic endopeptidase [Solirubrobacteraceae bacterium]